MRHIPIEQHIAFHCAPALAGIKPASLVSCCNEKNPDIKKYIAYLNRRLNKNDIYFETMCMCSKRTLVFVYRKKILNDNIYKTENKNFLKSIGYPVELGFDSVIQHMKSRIQNHEEFPHEIGVFLGYPLTDIHDFVKHKGTNYKINGYWKVYSNPEQATKLFNSYTRCRNTLLKRMSSGKTIVDLFGIHKKVG